MKRSKSVLILLVFYASISLAHAQQNFSLNGKIGDLHGIKKVYLEYNGKRDSAKIVDGRFSFKGALTKPVLAWLLFINKNGNGTRGNLPFKPLPFYLEPTAMTIISPDSLENATIKGGELNSQHKKFMTLIELSDKGATNENVTNTPPVGKMGEAMPITISDSLRQVRIDKQKSIARSFTENNPDAAFTIFLLKNFIGSEFDPAQAANLFNGLSSRVRNSALGMDYISEVKRLQATAIGAMAPDFTMPDTAGKLVSLSDFRGKYVLLDFWASWCTPCRAENPNVVKNYAIYHPKGFDILGVSIDNITGRNAWLKAIEDDKITWTQVSDLKSKNEAAQLYVIRSIPSSFLIGPDGKIIAKNLTGEKLGETLSQLFR